MRREGGGQGGKEEETIDMSQYMSSEEIHVAAMEGVKTATMKKLVSQSCSFVTITAVSYSVYC